MHTDDDVARQRGHLRNRLAEGLNERWSSVAARETETRRRDRVETVGVDDVVAGRAVAGPPRPRGCAGCMPRRMMRGDREIPDPHASRRPQRRARSSRRESHSLRGRIRTADRPASVRPARSRSLAGGAGRHCRAARPLERRDPARMIVMRVRIDDQLDVFGLESQLPDVGVDQRCRLRQPAVEEDRSGAAGDEQRRDARGADVIGVAEDSKRFVRPVPLVAVAALVRRIRPECADGAWANPRNAATITVTVLTIRSTPPLVKCAQRAGME